ncbi:CopG family ribbon-helix-helix protein [Chromobacterium rhizoryzae]|uniref:CopG family ribbon-helix-helix protein n=1 Tax=Chromobacterium rhizoryzae TaxID=1778675 RepID=UPI001D061332|nr:ribbon-helix-helix domain-containing protein [Chromobacterium rhizoryzae]
MSDCRVRVISVHVTIQMADRIDQMASRLERSPEWIMKQALSAWIEGEEKRERLTQEALTDVDLGQVISDQAVNAWVESLGAENSVLLPRKVDQ